MKFRYPTRPLIEFAKLLSGGTPSKAKPEFWDGDIPWITPKDMGNWDQSTADCVTPLAIGNGTRLVPAWTSYIAVRGMSLHNEIRVVRPSFPSTFNQDIKAVQALDDSKSRFLYYCLAAHKPTLLNKVESAGHGTGRLPTDQLEALPIPVVTNATESAVVKILGDLDDKIDLLRQMDEKLDEVGRTLFRAWFVDFLPVHAKVEGAASFRAVPQDLFDTLPDSFETSEIGEIPKGWMTRPLDSVAGFLNGLAMQKHRPTGDDKGLPVIKIAELRKGLSYKTERASSGIPDKYKVHNGDLIFSWSGSLMAKFWTDGDGGLNQHLFKVTSDHLPLSLVAHWVWHHLESFQMIAAGKATTMGHIKRGHLSEALVTLPPEGSLHHFTEVIDQLVQKRIAISIEQRMLTSLRDTLLPKLITGELEVPSLEALGVAEAA